MNRPSALTFAIAALTCPVAAVAGDGASGNAGIAVINAHARFPEGPLLSGNALYYVEYGGDFVTRWDGHDNRRIWHQAGCGPSAVVPFGADFAITCYDSGQLVIISKAGATLRSYDRDAAGNALNGPNDGTTDGRGGAWFTLAGPWEPGPIVGRVVHLSADGTLTEAATALHYANGIVTTREGRLYVIESEAGRIVSFRINPDFTLSDRRLFVALYQLGEAPEVFPDGMKIGPNGHFYVGEYSSGTVLEITMAGKIANRYALPSAGAPNLTFSADGTIMYVTAVDDKNPKSYSGKVYAVPVR